MTKLKNKIPAIVLGLAFAFTGCTDKKTLDCEGYIKFLRSKGSGLINNKSLSGINYTVFMEPPEYLVLRNNNFKPVASQTFNKEILDYKKSVYCSFIIKDEENNTKVRQLINNKSDYFRLVEFANNQLQQHLKMTVNNESVFCTVCHMEAPSSINPELRISIAFDYEPDLLYGVKSEGCEVIFEDEIFNTGIIKFSFDKSDLKNLPEIKI